MMDLESQRLSVRPLLDVGAPGDAMEAYYALYHDPARTELFLHYGADKRPDGFLARVQTGADLFRPLVIMRARSKHVATSLFQRGLIPGRSYYAVLPVPLAEIAFDELQLPDPQVLRIFRLDPARYQPVINVLVKPHRYDDGKPRYEIRSQDRLDAMAGINWHSPLFAEVYVFVDPAARGRGLGRSVVSALVGNLCASGLTPLYVVAEDNQASLSIAESVGFVDTGVQRASGFALCPGGTHT